MLGFMETLIGTAVGTRARAGLTAPGVVLPVGRAVGVADTTNTTPTMMIAAEARQEFVKELVWAHCVGRLPESAELLLKMGV